jgi:drug/metabolite transporter (DMT)-like permease
MTHADPSSLRRPAAWAVALAFTLVYLSWGTTFLAIREGVKAFPPALFGGVRIFTAGLVLLGYQLLRRQPLRLPVRDLLWLGLVGLCMFVGGNGLITVAEESVESGFASVLVATTPLWIALLELLAPRGERLTGRGWLGLFLGLAGVLVLLPPQQAADLFRSAGPLLVIGSAFSWAAGTVLLRRRRAGGPRLAVAAYQMLLGGGALILIGLALGEAGALTPERFTPAAVGAFFYLLVVGSLVGFVAYTWLLDHVSAAMAGTYAYVNPAVAILVGWLLAGEKVTLQILLGMGVILASVALVRSGSRRPAPGMGKVPGPDGKAHEANGACPAARPARDAEPSHGG